MFRYHFWYKRNKGKKSVNTNYCTLTLVHKSDKTITLPLSISNYILFIISLLSHPWLSLLVSLSYKVRSFTQTSILSLPSYLLPSPSIWSQPVSIFYLIVHLFFHRKFGVCFMKTEYESCLMNSVFSELCCFAICASMVIPVPGRWNLGFMWGCHWSPMAEMRKYLPNQQLGELLFPLHLFFFLLFFFPWKCGSDFIACLIRSRILIWKCISFYEMFILFGWGFSLL